MIEVKIDKDIPPPSQFYDWEGMFYRLVPGDSFTIPNEKTYGYLLMQAKARKMKLTKLGLRVWRIK